MISLHIFVIRIRSSTNSYLRFLLRRSISLLATLFEWDKASVVFNIACRLADAVSSERAQFQPTQLVDKTIVPG